MLIILSFLFASTSFADQRIQCAQTKNPRAAEVFISFDTDDLSGHANIHIKGTELFFGKNLQTNDCSGFAMRGKKYFNTFVIHSMGCPTWNCSLYTPDTIHGEPLAAFNGRLECYPADSDQNIWHYQDLTCRTWIESRR